MLNDTTTLPLTQQYLVAGRTVFNWTLILKNTRATQPVRHGELSVVNFLIAKYNKNINNRCGW